MLSASQENKYTDENEKLLSLGQKQMGKWKGDDSDNKIHNRFTHINSLKQHSNRTNTDSYISSFISARAFTSTAVHLWFAK